MIPFDDLVTPFTSVPPAVIPPPVVMDDKDSINEQLQDFLSSLSSNWPSEMSKKVYRYVIFVFQQRLFCFYGASGSLENVYFDYKNELFFKIAV